MPSEFDLIARHFTLPGRALRHTALGIGDDAALIAPTAGQQLAVTSDMLVAGTHFFADTDPTDLGWKTLAVNVSDLAAMGATPRWATLALALPAADEPWLTAFASGFFACADAFAVDLIGGDTTRGPLNLCVTLFGEVPPGQALRRDAGRPGDDIWVSGTPGLAALGLAHLQGRITLAAPDVCLAALHRPQPRVALGLALRDIAHAAIDVSDGLLADLGHILQRSACAAEVAIESLPSAALTQGAAQGADPAIAEACLLGGGDDYELIFTAAPEQRTAIDALAAQMALPLTRIGRLVAGTPGQLALHRQGQPVATPRRGFDHFA